ncbi:hypothetical protein FOYG_13312 [Fusarium oxysporum NRRL 32931]|uniref:Uncharacterized protein n=1 Tax=Fusarium oxysporum NRRL 32931 TaxID=660029 RepID=W9HRQ3_FUSOX|nr:hypothetical protein FOYG_13312 [Fusarium oxysporum NRRL 32931]
MADTVADDIVKCFLAFDDVIDALSRWVGLNSSFEHHIRNEQARFRIWHGKPERRFSATSAITIPRYMSQNREDTLCDLNGLLRYAFYIIQKERNYLKQLSSSENAIDNEGRGNDPHLIEDLVSIFTDISHSISSLLECTSANRDELCYNGTQDVGDIRSTSPDSRADDDGKGSYRHDGNGYFLPDCGIDREVIAKDICHYLGGNASVRLGYCEDIKAGRSVRGYFIKSQGKLTSAMIKRLQEDSKRWEKAKNEARKSGAGNNIMRSDTTTGTNVIQQIPEIYQPPHCNGGEGSNQDKKGCSPREAEQNHKRNRFKESRAELQPDNPDLCQESIPQILSATTSPNTGFALSSAIPAATGAINIASNGQAKVNSPVEVSNTTAAWIFGAVAAVTNGVTALATRQTAKASKRSAIAGEVAANASKRSAKAAEETCLIAQKHFDATVKDNQDRPPYPDTSQDISGAGAETSSTKEQKPDTRSRPVVPHGTGPAASPSDVPSAVLSPGLPTKPSGRGRVLRAMSTPMPGRREEIDISLNLATARAVPKIVWPEVPTCEFGKPCNCKIVPKN